MSKQKLPTLALVVLLGSTAWAQATLRVSVATDGTQANMNSDAFFPNWAPSVSADGRYVAFVSPASNLVHGDSNGFRDVFVRDLWTGVVEMVSISTNGAEGNDDSDSPSISADGRYVAFDSRATNLVPGDTNGHADAFVRDRQTGMTERVSVGSGGSPANWDSYAPSISGDGRYVCFESDATNLVPGDTNGKRDVFVHDRQSDTTTRVSVDSGGVQGNDSSGNSKISSDGRNVAFLSTATNLVSADVNGFADVFVRDLQLGTTKLVSVDSGGTQANGNSSDVSIAADGGFVVFSSDATNLVPGDTNGMLDVFVRDLQTSQTVRVSLDSGGVQGNDQSSAPSISADGRYVGFHSYATNLVPGDTNGNSDAFIRDRQSGKTERVSVSAAGAQGNGSTGTYLSMSADGRFLAFSSDASNLVSGDTNGFADVFVHDRQSGTNEITQRVSVGANGAQGNDSSTLSSISADGRYHAFTSLASNLVPGDTNGFEDVFVRDRLTGVTERVSVDSNGVQGNDDSNTVRISSDGRYVAFSSKATNLVPGDTNGHADVFVRDRQAGTTERVSVDSNGMQGNDDSLDGTLSADGRFVAFYSSATNLVAGDTNGWEDVFVHDRQTGTTERVSVDSAGSQANNWSGGGILSANGRLVAFTSLASNLVTGDTNAAPDVFVHDRQTGTTDRVSVATNGEQASNSAGGCDGGWISADGRYVTFETEADLDPLDTNLFHDVYVRDRLTGRTELVSVDLSGTAAGNNDSRGGTISADGRFVSFTSLASNLVSGDFNSGPDAFVRDRQTGTTELVSRDSSGAEVQGTLYISTSMTADGRFVDFQSDATQLVQGDTNGTFDVFVHDRFGAPAMTSLCDPGLGGVHACPCSNAPSGPGRGCNNSSATGGAILSASGGTFLSSDSLRFTTTGEKPTATSILMQGKVLASAGVVYGQGVRCTSGTLKRLYTKSASGGSVTVPNFGAGDPTVSAQSTAKGDLILAGQNRWYFVFYRDPIVLGGCPLSSTFNATQTGMVTWSP